MSSKLIILAALAAAAQASVDKNLAMEARAIVASHTHRQLDSRYLATTPSSAPATTHIKAKCVKGQPSNMFEQNGVTMIVPKTGYCIKTGPASSWLVKCDGLVLNKQDSAKADCTGITASTTKTDLKPYTNFTCTSLVEVQGVQFEIYQTEDCSDAPLQMPLKNDACISSDDGGVASKFTCDTSSMITFSGYKDPKKCDGKVLNTVSFKSDDGKCYNPVAPGNLPNSPSADASTNALATGFAVAGLIVSLVLM